MTQPRFHIALDTQTDGKLSGQVYTFFITHGHIIKKSVHTVFLTKQMIFICQLLSLGESGSLQVNLARSGLLWLIP